MAAPEDEWRDPQPTVPLGIPDFPQEGGNPWDGGLGGTLAVLEMQTMVQMSISQQDTSEREILC